MTADDLKGKLAEHLDPALANDLVSEFEMLRNDCKTGTLGRNAAGKFVETVVQVLQYMETNQYESVPKVDQYLRTVESTSSLNDDLRICCARVARACYTLRNKRSIAHKGGVDPNVYDLLFTFYCSQWILAEIVRQQLTSDMSTAGALIEYIRTPISPVIEVLGNRKLVHGDYTCEEEMLVLLHSYYPANVPRKTIRDSLDRRADSTVSKGLKNLWKQKLVHKEGNEYKLTQEGYRIARELLQKS